MSEINSTTLNSYEDHVQEYIDGTPHEVSGKVKDWIDQSLQGLPLDADILEIRSAFGRDAAYIESLGYTVHRTDATQGFVDYLVGQGYKAEHLNLLTDDIGKDHDLIFADAVLLHFDRDQVSQVLKKIQEGLSQSGRFAFSLKLGGGEGWSDAKLGSPRYFCYWQKDSIEEKLHGAGFSQVSTEDDGSEDNEAKWLHIVAMK